MWWVRIALMVLFVQESGGENDQHKSNQAVILQSSRYWFNYRHANNALSIYNILKKNGFDDENIVLMIADEFAGNPRNPFKNQMYANGVNSESWFHEDTEIDYRGDDVTVDNLRRVFLGKGSNRVLKMDNSSNVLVFWTGHGGDSFFKFQDVEEITANDIARYFDEMEFNELLFIADTCQAFTLGNSITASNVYMIGSSLKGENSYAHHSDSSIGLSVIERYSHTLSEHIRRNGIKGSLKQNLIDPFHYEQQRAHVGMKQTEGRSFQQIPMADFFVNVQSKNKMHLVPKSSFPFRWDTVPKFDAPANAVLEKSEISLDSSKQQSVGMSPSDPIFLSATIILLSVVYLSSKKKW